MYELKIKGHIARNWGHVPICFKIGNVSLNFCMSLISMHIVLNCVKKIMFMKNSG